jgi:hypothetical protein
VSQESDQTDQEEQSVAEVERIRDILFGSQMRRYEQQFKRMASQLDLLGKQFEDLRTAVEQQQADQEQRAHALQEELLRHQGDLEHSVVDRLAKLDSGVEQQATQVRELAAELRKQANDLRSEFAAGLDELGDDKASRLDLADLLMEMGTRLKGQMGFADLLGQLDEAAKGESPE